MLVSEYQRFVAENEDILFLDPYYIGIAIVEKEKTLVFIRIRTIGVSTTH